MRGRAQPKKNSKPREGSFDADHMDPPQFASTTQITRTYRFAVTGGALAYSVTQKNLCDVAGLVCTVANSTLSAIADAFRLHSVTVWVPAASNGVATQSSVQMYTLDYGPARERSNVSLSTARPTRLFIKPRPGEAGYQRLKTGSQIIFGIAAPQGSIIDLHMTHWLYDSAGAGTSYTVAAGVLGALYYAPLDGTTDIAVPVGLPTTT